MMCRKSVLMNQRVYIDTSVCQTYSKTFFRGKRAIYPGWDSNQRHSVSSYGAAQQAVLTSGKYIVMCAHGIGETPYSRMRLTDAELVSSKWRCSVTTVEELNDLP